VVGWLNTKMYLETGDEVKSQGWTPLVIDTNGNGKRDEYVGHSEPGDRRRTSASWRRSTACSRARSTIDLGTAMDVGFTRLDQPATQRLVPGPTLRNPLVEVYLPPDGVYGSRGLDSPRTVSCGRVRAAISAARPAQVPRAAERPGRGDR